MGELSSCCCGSDGGQYCWRWIVSTFEERDYQNGAEVDVDGIDCESGVVRFSFSSVCLKHYLLAAGDVAIVAEMSESKSKSKSKSVPMEGTLAQN